MERNSTFDWPGVDVIGRLAVVCVITGVAKVFPYEKARKLFPWVNDVSSVLAQFIGIIEILGASGLIFPVVTRDPLLILYSPLDKYRGVRPMKGMHFKSEIAQLELSNLCRKRSVC